MSKLVNTFIKVCLTTWFAAFITCIAVDVINFNKDRPLIEYTVVSKAQEYSYHKSNTSQVNTLILKNKANGKIESKEVDVVTHYEAKEGGDIYFAAKREVGNYTFVLSVITIAGIVLLFLVSLIISIWEDE